MKFQKCETVICSIEVRNAAGTLIDPSSMQISILDASGGVALAYTNMSKDPSPVTGKYYTDYLIPADIRGGTYTVLYKATDASRISIHKDTFEVE